MDNDNSRPGTEPYVETGGDWRTQLPPDSHQRIVNKIMEVMKRNIPFSGPEALEDLKKLVLFEEKFYSTSLSESDYRKRMSVKMLAVVSKSQNTVSNSFQPNPSGNTTMPLDSRAAYHNMQPQVQIKSEPLPMAMLANQSQPRPPSLSQLGLQQLPNDMQLGLQASTKVPHSLNMQQNVVDQQHFLYQSQTPLPETLSMSLDSTAQIGYSSGGDWQDEVHQKIKALKEMYLPELNEIYQKIASKLQYESLPQPPKSEQLHNVKLFKATLERVLAFFQVSKTNVLPSSKDWLGSYEKNIIKIINWYRVRKSIPPLQQGHLGEPDMQQSQSQISQVLSHENPNPQLQYIYTQGSASNMQQNNMAGRQYTSMSSLPGFSTLQQNTVSGPTQVNVAFFPSRGGMNMLQPNIPLQSNPNMLQQQELTLQEMLQPQFNPQKKQQQLQHLMALQDNLSTMHHQQQQLLATQPGNSTMPTNQHS
ncbi:Mediator of RNA polymerase II transcription subunit 15a [Euphorbia peplus]|nr:Mediator of RNA polymerase II transcription subunit 15a [Euphorbia peplus]